MSNEIKIPYQKCTKYRCPLPEIMHSIQLAHDKEIEARKNKDYEAASAAKRESVEPNRLLDDFKSSNKGNICSDCTLF